MTVFPVLRSSRGRRLFLVAASFDFALSACSPPAPPTLTPRQAVVKAVTATGLQVEVTVDATNPNSTDLTAQKVSGKVTVHGQPLGTMDVPQNVTLRGGATTTIAVELDAPWQNMNVIAPLALAGAPVPYAIDGSVTVGGTRLNVDLPFHFDGVVTPQQMRAVVGASIPKGLHF